MLLLVAVAAPAAVYRYVDENGQIHFTDSPVPGADPMDLPEAQTYSPADLPPPPPLGDMGDRFQYGSITIAQPQPEATFRSAERTVPVRVAVQPSLRESDRIMIYLDGEPALPAPSRSGRAVLKVTARGTHHVSAAVIDSSGEPIGRSESVEFYMKPPVVNALDNVN